jgi:hypothetical protein
MRRELGFAKAFGLTLAMNLAPWRLNYACRRFGFWSVTNPDKSDLLVEFECRNNTGGISCSMSQDRIHWARSYGRGDDRRVDPSGSKTFFVNWPVRILSAVSDRIMASDCYRQCYAPRMWSLSIKPQRLDSVLMGLRGVIQPTALVYRSLPGADP